ncbi:mechanosensitive ion channel family protein [Qipengyuania sp. RANM35]|uniref:mechanosensitive ion channel family protein n=1 Tax=Qipengyuania sp. RANM35 TaxID=3068635 RepID=UPI0034DB14DD
MAGPVYFGAALVPGRWSGFLVACLALFFSVPVLAATVGDTALPQAVASDGAELPAATAQPSPYGRVTDPDVSATELAYLLVPLTKQELENTARRWQEIVRTKTQEISELQVNRAQRGGKADQAQLATLITLIEERARLLERFALVIDSLERKDGNPDLVSEMRAYRKAILYEETSQASFKALAGSLWEWLGRTDGGLAVLLRIAIAGLALLAIVFVARFLRSLARFWIGRFTRISRLLQGFIVGALYWVFIIIGLAIVLSSVDVDITPMFAVIGGASFILAFAFQDTLGNLASGLMIMINQPFDEGDFIEVGGVGGTVKKVTMVGTTVATPDNRIVIVPNKSVWGNVIINASASDIRRVDLSFSASYGDPIQKVLEVISECVEAHPKVLSDPPVEIRPSDLGASAVIYVCRPWAKAEDYWDVHCDLTQGVKEAFESNGLSMPFPQHDVHVRSRAQAAA